MVVEAEAQGVVMHGAQVDIQAAAVIVWRCHRADPSALQTFTRQGRDVDG